MAYSVLTPHKVIYGPGALDEAAALLPGLGATALVVTDAMMGKLGNLKKVIDALEGAGVAACVYDEVNAEPTDEVVRAGVRLFTEGGCDFMVALGGGSPIDTMKAIALCVATGQDIDSFLGTTYEGTVCPMVAIPTTAGTGSEATQFTIITDTARDIKMLLRGEALIPQIAVVDPQFTLTAPPNVTSATGIDALCHATEAYTSRRAQPISDTFALSAVKRIFGNLETCYREPGNIEARTQMAIASFEAGVAFNNASVTIVHGMSRPIGALFHVPHGLSNAMLLGACLRFAVDGAYDRFAQLARYCGISSASDDVEAATAFVEAVERLLANLDVPTPRAYGVPEDAYRASIDKMAADAMASGSPSNTIKGVTNEDLIALYNEVYGA